MNLEMKVHPALVALVIALTALAIALKFWADEVALSYGGPSQLLAGPDGHIYVQIQNRLLEHSADGEFVQGHDLGELGVDTVIGALAFFSNGDILLRRGADRRGFANTIAAFQRRENSSDLVPESPDAGLARCDLQAQLCTPFADPAIDFKSTIGIVIDWRNDDVYISDTSRHTLRKYSADGVQLAEPRRSFKFPNQVLLHAERLLVADTNHHQIRVLDSESQTFARTIRPITVVPDEAQRVDQRWPSHFARIGDEWWVNNMNSAMRNGGIYVFDDDWRYQRRIALPGNADPISILPFASGALISDWDNDRIYRVSGPGTVLDDFRSPALEAIIEESRKQRTFYGSLSWMGVALLCLTFVGLITKAMTTPKEKIAAAPVDSGKPQPHSRQLTWFEPDPRIVRKIRLNMLLSAVAMAALVALSVGIVAVYGNAAIGLRLLPSVCGLIVILALINWVVRSNVGTAIGFEDNDIILRNHAGAESRHPVKAVVYDKKVIATPDMAVVLGQHPMPLYEPDVVTHQILPRLTQAEAITSLSMQRVLIRLRHPLGLTTLLAIIALAVAAIAYLLR